MFEAIDKVKMNTTTLIRDREITEFVGGRMDRTPSERGPYACTISHNRLWRKLVREASRPDDQYLIFEDDSIIPPDFLSKLEKAMRVVPKDWDLLYLNHNRLLGQNLPGDVWFKPAKEYPGMGTNALMNAYLVRPSGLERILRFQHPISFVYTNDDNLRRHFMDFNAYFMIEKLVNTRGASVRKGWSKRWDTTTTVKPTRKGEKK